MSSNLNIDEAVEFVKLIVENNKCGICDVIGGKRVRYSCSHLSCSECVAQAGNCVRCLTPPGDTITHFPDNPATIRAQNAANLIKTFEETYKVDVYRRQRISEQLKVEKELFPECIQAPIKYFNRKRKNPHLSKENRGPSFFPGENISPVKASKMENSCDYVKKWLDDNGKAVPPRQTRRPFADLIVNRQRIPRRADVIMDKVKDKSKNITKKKKKENTFLDLCIKSAGKQKESKNSKSKNESGIVIDDEAIVIDDSQSEVIDKDNLAWMAVIEANEKDPYISQTLGKGSEVLAKNNNSTIPVKTEHKVPFYKRSPLAKAGNLIDVSVCKKGSVNQITVPPKDVSITIENKSFVATITMSTVQSKSILDKQSVPVQTDISCIDDSGCDVEDVQNSYDISIAKENVATKCQKLHSQDLFTAESNIMQECDKNVREMTIIPHVTTQLVIADSDNEDVGNESSLIEVTAEVHQSSENLALGVLSELDVREVQQRAKRYKRGHTPNSTDSSDKENFDPNRAKRAKLNKKTIKKRKSFYNAFELNSIDQVDEFYVSKSF